MVLVTAKNGLSGTFIPKRLTATYTITSATAPRRMPAATGPGAEPPPPDPAEVSRALQNRIVPKPSRYTARNATEASANPEPLDKAPSIRPVTNAAHFAP